MYAGNVTSNLGGTAWALPYPARDSRSVHHPVGKMSVPIQFVPHKIQVSWNIKILQT